jgi:hypothetical protein
MALFPWASAMVGDGKADARPVTDLPLDTRAGPISASADFSDLRPSSLPHDVTRVGQEIQAATGMVWPADMSHAGERGAVNGGDVPLESGSVGPASVVAEISIDPALVSVGLVGSVPLSPDQTMIADGLTSADAVSQTISVWQMDASLTGNVTDDRDVQSGLDPAPDLKLPTACFMRGTHILTPHGEIPIEQLKPGQLVVTATGQMQPIRAVGRRVVAWDPDLESHLIAPVRIRATSFTRMIPHRDLLVSPLQSVLVDGTLIPVRALINGRNILRDPMPPKPEYFHIALDTQDLVLAEGLPLEAACISEHQLRRAHQPGTALPLADATPADHAGHGHLPQVLNGPAVEATRAKLLRNAAARRKAARRRAA